MGHEPENEEQASPFATPACAQRGVVGNGLLFLTGLVAGAAVALLFAPQTGKQTQDLIAQNVATAGKKIQAHAHDLVEKGQDLVGKGRAMVDTGKDHISQAIAVGKEAYREQKSASS